LKVICKFSGLDLIKKIILPPGTAESLKVQAKIKISNFLTDNVACS
jgi:hypothetical protein